jgi:hypothetical protein
MGHVLTIRHMRLLQSFLDRKAPMWQTQDIYHISADQYISREL